MDGDGDGDGDGDDYDDDYDDDDDDDDDERVGGSRLWLPSAGAAAGVLQVTGAPGTLISLKRLQLRGEVLHEGPLRSIRGDIF